MEATTAASATGSLAAVGSSLANVGSTMTAFAMGHPVTMAAVGGTLFGMGIYYAIAKKLSNKKAVAAPAMAAA